MGYCSTMEGDVVFRSPFLFEELKQLLSERKGLADDYIVEEAEGDIRNGSSTYAIKPKDGDYYGKHYNDQELSEFISEVISLDDWAKLIFTGEDGEKWGYAIFHTNPFDIGINHWNISMIEYVAMVDGLPIGEFARKYLKKQEVSNE